MAIQGNGLGGRNQEFALAAAIEIDGLEEVVVLSGGTDGTDGRRTPEVSLTGLRFSAGETRDSMRETISKETILSFSKSGRRFASDGADTDKCHGPPFDPHRLERRRVNAVASHPCRLKQTSFPAASKVVDFVNHP